MKKIIWTSPATRFIKLNQKKFTENLSFKINQPNEYDDFITSSVNPSLQGTMLDTLFSWLLNQKFLIDKYEILKRYMLSSSQIKEEINSMGWYWESFEIKLAKTRSDNSLFKFAYLSAILTHGFRSGNYELAIEEFLQKRNNVNNYLSQQDYINLNKLLDRIMMKIDKIRQSKEVVDNPLFGCELPNKKFIQADGDYFYDSILGDMKSSKNPNIKKYYLYQMIFYNYLNKYHPNPFKIKYFEIFNPLYNIEWKIELEELNLDYNFLDQDLNHE